MTDRQRELARHALGLSGVVSSRVTVTFRNFYCAALASPDHAEWLAMVVAGEATGRPNALSPATADLFFLTRAGAQAALQPGESLDPEDFPAHSDTRTTT